MSARLFYDVRKTDIIYALAEDDVYSTTDGGTTLAADACGHRDQCCPSSSSPGIPIRFLAGFEDQGHPHHHRWRQDLECSAVSVDRPRSMPWRRRPMAACPVCRRMEDGRLAEHRWRAYIGRDLARPMRSKRSSAFWSIRTDPHHVYAGTDGNGVYESAMGECTGRTRD